MPLRIGITMRVVQNDTYPEKRDAISTDWTAWIRRYFPRSIVVLLPNRPEDVGRTLRDLRIGALILSNGNDWGEAPERDETERRVVRYAASHEIPLLGVCRGMQALNVCFGGKITRDIRQSARESHRGTPHPVTLCAGSPFRRYSRSATMSVNSYHNQGVLLRDVAPPLKAFAVTSGHVVEGLYHPGKPIAGIQWHPERKNPSASFDRKFIRDFFS